MGSSHEASSMRSSHDGQLTGKLYDASLRPEDSTSQRAGQKRSWSTKSQDGCSKSQESSTTGSDWSFVKAIHPNDPDSTVTGAVSRLSRRNLKKNHEESHRRSIENNADPDHHQRQRDNLKRTLSSLGVESSDELIGRMVPTSGGEAPMTKFLAEKHDETVEEKIYRRESKVDKDKRNT